MTDSESLQELLDQLGPDARWGRVVVARLAAGPAPIDELVHASGLSRRTVERLVTAFDGSPPVTVAPAPDRARLPQLDIDSEIVRTIADLIGRAPAARQVLDQIPADAATVVARAALLRSQFDVVGGQLVVLGDHDLTSIAAVLAMPEIEITVVDIDEPLLEFIDGTATERGLAIRTLFADLRDGLPDALVGTAALVFTDPPYSADGVALFLERALSAPANRDRGPSCWPTAPAIIGPTSHWRCRSVCSGSASSSRRSTRRSTVTCSRTQSVAGAISTCVAPPPARGSGSGAPRRHAVSHTGSSSEESPELGPDSPTSTRRLRWYLTVR